MMFKIPIEMVEVRPPPTVDRPSVRNNVERISWSYFVGLGRAKVGTAPRQHITGHGLMVAGSVRHVLPKDVSVNHLLDRQEV